MSAEDSRPPARSSAQGLLAALSRGDLHEARRLARLALADPETVRQASTWKLADQPTSLSSWLRGSLFHAIATMRGDEGPPLHRTQCGRP